MSHLCFKTSGIIGFFLDIFSETSEIFPETSEIFPEISYKRLQKSA